jgi:hypothetical protein
MRFYPVPPVAAAPLLAQSLSTPVRAQTIETSRPSRVEPGFVASHWEAIALGAGLVAAGIGTGVLLWKRRRPEPAGGAPRTESQRKALEEALRLEKNLLSPDGRLRLESLLGLLNLLLRLTPEDRPERIRRIAAQLCTDWPAINKDRRAGDEIKNRIPRLLRPFLDQLTAEIVKRTDSNAADHIRANAQSILKWIHSK